jgi:hypothetical protein
MSGVILALAALVIFVGCTSPETNRTRGGSRGADLGYRGSSVDLHEGAEPYYRTPQVIDSRYARPGTPGDSERASRR